MRHQRWGSGFLAQRSPKIGRSLSRTVQRYCLRSALLPLDLGQPQPLITPQLSAPKQLRASPLLQIKETEMRYSIDRRGLRSHGDSFSSNPLTGSLTQEKKLERQRIQMVMQLQGWQIRDHRLLKTMAELPRHHFVPLRDRNWAYEDRPLPMGYGQQVTQPHMVAYMLEQADIRADHRILEIGTGLGYQTAILGQLARRVYSLEIIPSFAETAHQALGSLGYRNVSVRRCNGIKGLPERAPYDRIIVCGAVPKIPKALLKQLALDGKLIIPIGKESSTLHVITRTAQGKTIETKLESAFEPLLDHCPPSIERQNGLPLRHDQPRN